MLDLLCRVALCYASSTIALVSVKAIRCPASSPCACNPQMQRRAGHSLSQSLNSWRMHAWPSVNFIDATDALNKLTGLQGDRWICRGQPETFNCLRPSIDRDGREHLSRIDKLRLERQSIDMFRSTARFFAGDGEAGALVHNNIALMVMRHYGVPTRLLDWSLSPFVAAFFACETDKADGEIWAFSYDQYITRGNAQWKSMPEALNNGQWDCAKQARERRMRCD